MIEYTVNDTSPALVLRLEADGEAVSLSDVLSATLLLRKPSDEVVEASMDVDSAQGLVSYEWDSTDLDEVGTYECDLLLIRTDTSRQHALRRFLIRVRAEYEEPE